MILNFEEPIRAEIFSASRLESHAISLAQSQPVLENSKKGKDFSDRITENRQVLESSYAHILQAVEDKRAITPAAEWLIDNFHIIRSLLKDIHDHLPPKFYQELPKLAAGPLIGYPRVFGIAWAYVAHTDSSFDPELLRLFLKSYQTVQPLTIGELWAVPITLRVLLIENLRRLAERIVRSQTARKQADAISDEVLGLSGSPSRPIEVVIKHLSQIPFSASLAVQLLQRLRFQESRIDPILHWLNGELAKNNTNPDEAVSDELNGQTGANATVRNIITSSRQMAAFNWQDFFEEVSLVEEALRSNPIYEQLDFSTRNRYRQALEELAKHSPVSELEIARVLVKRTQWRPPEMDPNSSRTLDLGYYLISSGRHEVEKEIKFRANLRLKLTRFYVNYGIAIYLSNFLLLTCLPLFFASDFIHHSVFLMTIAMVLAFFPASEVAISLINRLTVAFLGPRHLPRLSLRFGIPEDLKTFVVVPTLFTKPHQIESQLEQLEIHYLSNNEQNVYFALLSDVADNDSENTFLDIKLLEIAKNKLDELNNKYPTKTAEPPRFYIFHRRRLYNPREGKWMGWERKRGKLHEFNRLALGHKDTSFISLDENPVSIPKDVRFVITLDADTRLPNGSVLQLIGTLAHPLNRPRIDSESGRVTGGYGILQPRITPALPSLKDSTVFQRISTGDAGLDPYASAISDVYQDLFSEGSYTGKGIYDVKIFEEALSGRIPENSLLSHDLFEGIFARCGLISDVEFLEDFPFHTEVSFARSHRWARGDWQLLPWLLGQGGRCLPALGAWKIIDNLRRSLLGPACFFLLILAFSFPTTQQFLWVGIVLLSFSMTTLLAVIAEVLNIGTKISWRDQMRFAGTDFLFGLERIAFQIILLSRQSWNSIDAISRSLYRIFISQRKMLEWTTAAQAQAAANVSFNYFFKSYIGSLILTFLGAGIVLFFNSQEFIKFLPFVVLWLGAPLIARQMSSPPKPKLIKPLRKKDVQYLRLAGRRVWSFFTTFVTEEDHFLPPDNFQETPVPVLAHRSSPTNFGLYLLSVLAAKDFAWIGTSELAQRLSQTLNSLTDLPKFEGHFFNWYETREARALEPKYISAVDNGNLAGHLLAVSQGCLEIATHPIPVFTYSQGIMDALLVLEDVCQEIYGPFDGSQSSEPSGFSVLIKDLKEELLSPDFLNIFNAASWKKILSKAENLSLKAQTIVTPEECDSDLIKFWTNSILQTANSLDRDINYFFPWLKEVQNTQILSSEAQGVWDEIQSRFTLRLPLHEMAAHSEGILSDLIELKNKKWLNDEMLQRRVSKMISCFEQALVNASTFQQKMIQLHDHCHVIFNNMNFNLLYDKSRKLFSIGYRVNDKALDSSYYDLLASEARLTSFIAIAKGDIPASHWFQLGRGLTKVSEGAMLVSWSGSMFEYLMPSLVMREPDGSLISQTCELAVQRQILYGSEKVVPWGISESAYNKRDIHLTYQYSNFGVPDLGLKRGLGADLVVAPYATILGSMFESASGVENLRKIQALGGRGQYGFYEAIDFTPARLPKGQTSVVIKAYMAHHQGMSLVAIANIFKNEIMRDRFHAEPMVQATELLLQERMPRNVSVAKPAKEIFQVALVREDTEHVSRQYHTVHRPVPTTQLFSNGEYSVMLTSSGSGYSRWQDLALTRWREDVTCDQWGHYIFLKDLESDKVWSAGYQPTCVEPDSYEVTFYEDRARFVRSDQKISSDLEIFVSPEDHAEIRRLTLKNNGNTEREIEITSYAEVVLNSQLADIAHPAFSNLFIQTEYIPELKTLLAWRRPRSATESETWMAVVLQTDAQAFGRTEYETDRSRFLGRGRTIRNPQAISDLNPLSNTTGSVLDPIMSLRTTVFLPIGVSSHITFSTVVAKTREEVLHLADKFHSKMIYDRVAGLTWTQAQVKLHYFNIEPDEAHLFQRLATRLIYSDSSLRPSGEIIKRNAKDVTGLWGFGISGDDPIALVRIDQFEDRGIIRQLLKAHEYLASKGLPFDLVIFNEQATSYAEDLQNSLLSLVYKATAPTQNYSHRRGKAFVIRADKLSNEDRHLLFSFSRATLSGRQGSLSEQVKRTRVIVDKHVFAADQSPAIQKKGGPLLPTPKLDFFNGLGGFSEDGKEYIISLKGTEKTPMPWSNVIANSQFGFLATESGSGYTWAHNSRENQITPWQNDPVSDPSGEAFYILDVETRALWSPTALPIRVEDTSYIVHHSQGYSRFEHLSHGVYSDLYQYVAWDQPVKISSLTIENRSKGIKNLVICSYVEWVLGFSRSTMAPTTVTEFDETVGAIFAHNARNSEYGTQISFSLINEGHRSFTGDRTEFIGRNGSMDAPAGMFRRTGLSGRVGAALDPCAALDLNIHLAPGEKKTITFFLGQAENRVRAREMISHLKIQFQKPEQLLEKVKSSWDQILNKVQVQTPDKAMNLMLNRWLLYQTLASRFWARTGFYQAGGAYGFRDQLQDVMALTVSQPKIAREHILRAASRQFVEGDVQHWWHPPAGRGVRTQFSDDLIWLPYVVFHYLKVTNDLSILEAEISFLEGPLLRPDQENSYYAPAVSHNSATLYNHCVRALDKSLPTGEHGLPLIGAGDWNDGMNRVGHAGKGESVWLAWFLYKNLEQFSEIAKNRGDTDKALVWKNHALNLQRAAEENAWDGEWYKRAFFDDGTPLGSASQAECKIDSLAQTWAIISGAADQVRGQKAMEAVEKYLVRPENKMILLFTPPFDKTPLDPGYIKGYLPGVRENGGQYTHAAVWCIFAHTELGHGTRAVELFSMLNPINHGASRKDVETYKVEPYVLAADIYSQAPYAGRGGWTWYTGSCGWMYRAGLEAILGFHKQGDSIYLKPCIPDEWENFKVTYRHSEKTNYEISYQKSDGLLANSMEIFIDGKTKENHDQFELVDDGKEHQIQVTLGSMNQ